MIPKGGVGLSYLDLRLKMKETFFYSGA